MAGRSYCRLIEGELFVKPFHWRFKPRGPKSFKPYSDIQMISGSRVHKVKGPCRALKGIQRAVRVRVRVTFKTFDCNQNRFGTIIPVCNSMVA